MNLERQVYRDRCGQRWSGPALSNALRNWRDFESMQKDLVPALRKYLTHHSDSLSSFLWQLQKAWQPDRSCLYPLLDFCEHYQRIFLRRGLYIYCEMLLAQFDQPAPEDPNQLLLPRVSA